MVYLPISDLKYPFSRLDVGDEYQTRCVRYHAYRNVSMFSPNRIQICEDLPWQGDCAMEVSDDMVLPHLCGLKENRGRRLNHRSSVFEEGRIRDFS